jgi:menaquinone-dependent protoporphyrinogen oxidase
MKRISHEYRLQILSGAQCAGFLREGRQDAVHEVALMPLIGRRRFLVALAGVAAIAAGIRAATWRPATTLITSACQGDTQMTDRILVAYATRTGSTAEVADRIARHLCEAGLAAEARPVGEVTGLDGYSGAVLGSAVRYGSWLPEMTDFVSENRGALSAMPVAYFTMHMLALGDDPAAAAERAKYTAKARDLVTPADEVFFEGMIEPARLSLFDRLAVRLVKSPVGDRRDWDRIAAWADELAPQLASAPA